MEKYIILGGCLVILSAVYYFFNPASTPMHATSSDSVMQENSPVQITPISHATSVLAWSGKTIYTDPVGGAESFNGKSAPDIILLTDIHSDHLDDKTLLAVVTPETVIVAPRSVAEKLPAEFIHVVVLQNNETQNVAGFNIEAIPMYNEPESEGSFHVKGRGNGYVIEKDGYRVYISGDTGNTPEMRALKKIDLALVCMNLPYTMSVEDAAEAVLAFKPKRVIPYHYRGPDGLSDVGKFKSIVESKNKNINVELLNWYPEK